MATSRLKNTLRNTAYSYICSVATLILGFISRTVFINTLGATYLGVNGLFTNVLGVLSFAELGIGTAMNFSLYKPVAENDKKKIKSLMYFYKISYRVIAAVVAVIGLLLVPFLRYIVKDPGNIGNISVYYLIFLFNTVITYLVSYKFSLVNAEQKNYIFSNINTITNTVTIIFQMVSLLIFKNFLVYLLIASIIGVMQKIFISRYLNKMYPYLMGKDVERISKEDLKPIKKNVYGAVLHKIGGISVNQTDNIIISSFINVTTVGIISNYNLILNSVNSFVTTAFNSVTASMGNLIATESQEKQYEVFKIYRFIAAWVFGFVSIAIYILSTPFITLWLGKKFTIANIVILLMMIDYYMKGHRICILNIKSAGGIFYQDRYVSLVQAVINLVVSVVMVKLIGLPGVYIGTVAQDIVGNIIKPYITYKNLFNVNPKYYFIDSIKYGFIVCLAWVLCALSSNMIFNESVNVFNFCLMTIIVAIVPNILFFIFFHKTKEFTWIKDTVIQKIRERRNVVG